MDLFWKAAAGVLIAAVLGLALGKDISLLLALGVCGPHTKAGSIGRNPK